MVVKNQIGGGSATPGVGDMEKATYDTNLIGKDIFDIAFYTPIESSSSVNPLVPWRTYQFTTSAGALTAKLPDPVIGIALQKFQVALAHNGNSLTLDTVSGTALIGTSTTQIMNDVNTSLLVQVNAAGDAYNIILDTRHDVSGILTLLALTETSTLPPYTRITTSTGDPAYSSTAIDGSTGSLSSGLNTVGATIADPGLIFGLLPETRITSLGQIRKTLGSGNATFYTEYYHVDGSAVETLIGTSNVSQEITNASYAQFSVSAILDETEFAATDRFLVKTIADWDGGGSAPTYEVQFEGPTPARGELSIGIASIGLNRDNLITMEPSGFQDPSGVVESYNSTTRTVTLTEAVVGEGIDFYWQGQQIPAMIDGWESDPHPATLDKKYMLQYNGSAFEWVDLTATALLFSDAFVVFINHGTTDKWAVREPHGLMQWQGHRSDHINIGTYKTSGGTLGAYTLSSTTAADRRPSVSESLIWDEDVPTTIPALAAEGNYSNFYLSGAGATANFDLTEADIVPLSTNQPYWNEYTGGSWQQTLMSNNYHMNIYVVQIPVTSDANSQAYRNQWVQGQAEYATLTGALSEKFADISLGELTELTNEFISVSKVTIKYTAANWTIEFVTALTGSRFAQVGSPAGNYLSAVTTTDNLLGIGTVSDPLIAMAGGPFNTLTYGATITPDQADGKRNFAITATGDFTLANMSGAIAGTEGFIEVTRSAAGTVSMSLGAEYDTPAGGGITLTDTNGAVDIIPYYRKDAVCRLGFSGDSK